MSEVVVKAFRTGDYIKEGFQIYKSNIGPCVIGTLLSGIPGVQLNLMTQILKHRATGEAIVVGELFNFDNIINKWLVFFVNAIYVPCFAGGLMAEHPSMSLSDAFKVGLAFGLKNPVAVILFLFITSLVAASGIFLCCLGILLTFPAMVPILAVAYEDHRETILAIAAEEGVVLPQSVLENSAQ